MKLINVFLKRFLLFVCCSFLVVAVVCKAADDWLSLAQEAEKILNESYEKDSVVAKTLRKELDRILNGKYSEKTKVKKLKSFIKKIRKNGTELSSKEKDLIEGYRDSLVVVEGSKGVGSGFVTEIKGKKFIFTNAHVVVGNSSVKFFNIDGKKLKTKSLYMSRDRDIFIALLDTEKNDMPALPIHEDVSSLKVGTSVYVTGNSAGGGTMTKLKGKVKSVGPSKIEVDAKFVTGNSGSPIVTPDGKVVGIATYITRARVKWHNKDSEFTKVRRFGFRVDNIEHSNKSWIKINLARYKRDLNVYKRVQKANELGVTLITDLWYDNDKIRLSPSNYLDHKGAQDLVKEWNMALTSGTFMNYSVFIDRMKDMIAKPGLISKKHRFTYPLFKNYFLRSEQEFNKILVKEFTGISKDIEANFNEYRRRRYRR
ncbi:serine protease [Lentisphaerota bacterium WC36G]|nr:serine protease [Lentisphaerae bacterium WC36]